MPLVSCPRPECQQPLRVPDTAVGSLLRCPHCRQDFRLAPTATTPPPSTPPAETCADEPPPPTVPPAPPREPVEEPRPEATPAPLPSAVPIHIGRFEVRQRLGEGAFGVVYRAYDAQLDREVALKVAKPHMLNTEARVKRFLREAKAAANLRHPNIVPVHDSGKDGEQYFIASAFIPGQSLASALEESPTGRGLERRQVAQIVRKVAEALAYAHGKGVIHRDVKPANVMLDEQGEPLLMDFGLAARPEGDEKLTQEGALMGTPAYMAPEQAAGLAEAASDQYSLGCTLYELLTGQTPFAGPPEIQLFLHQTQEAPSPRTVERSLPSDLETICLKTLAKKPAERYADCQALADDLRRWLEGEPIAARRLRLGERLLRWVRKEPKVAAALSLAAALLIVVAVVTTLSARRQQELTAQAQSETLLKQQALTDVERMLTRMTLEKGLAFCETGDPDRGMLSIIQALESRGADSADMRHYLRWQLAMWAMEVQPLKQVFVHDDGIVQARFSPDGRLVCTASLDKTARVWDTATGQAVGSPLRHPGGLYACAFSPDGKAVLTGCGDGGARLWSVPAGKLLQTLRHKEWVRAVAFTPDGKLVLTASDRSAQLWDPTTGARVGDPWEHPAPLEQGFFSPDGKTVLTVDEKSTVRLWGTATRRPVGQPMEHKDRIADIAFSPDGKLVVACCHHGTERWDAVTGQMLGEVLGQPDYVTALACSPDNKHLVCAGANGTTRLWDLQAGKPVRDLPRQVGLVNQAHYSPDGKIFAASCRSYTQLWDTTTWSPIGKALRQQGSTYAVIFNPDSKTVLTTGADGTARLWGTESRLGPREPLGSGPALVLAVSPDGTRLMTGHFEREARLWDLKTGRMTARLAHSGTVKPPLLGSVYSVAFSADGLMALTVGEDRTARLWNGHTGAALVKPLAHPDACAAALTRDKKQVLTVCWDGKGRLWNADSGEIIGQPFAIPESTREGRERETNGPYIETTIAPDGKRAAMALADGKAWLWDIPGRNASAEALEHRGAITQTAFSPDGKVLLTAAWDGTARLWSADTGKPVGEPIHHHPGVGSVAFSPDGELIITSASDTARLWETATGRPLGGPMRHPGRVWSVAYSPDGQTVLTGCHDYLVRWWKVPVPMKDQPERIKLWLAVHTGMEMDSKGAVVELDAETWRKRYERLRELGGLQRP